MNDQETRKPLRARERLAVEWFVVPAVIVAVFAVGFGLKLLL